jgi:hypothetical protein
MNKVAKRLSSYWRMEAANVVLLPVFATVLVFQFGGALSMAFVVAAFACAALLVIGTAYLRGLYHRALGDDTPMRRALPWIARAQRAAVLAPITAAVWLFAELLRAKYVWAPQTIAAAVLTILAALEYVNYYHIQLQHFDNAADFRRLMAGKGFRRSHMAKDLAAWRAEKKS